MGRLLAASLWLFVLRTIAAVVPQNYCATVTPSEANGASGWFTVQLTNAGTAKYLFNVDVSALTDKTCDLSKGLLYHLHTLWKPTAGSAQGGAACGSALTGGHYDPNFACSSVSADCLKLNRTASRYNCETTAYSGGAYEACELGDLSGKFGTAAMTNNKFAQVVPLIDTTPPYGSQYMKTAPVNAASTWASVVFHCGADKSRFLCAKLSLVRDGQTSPCPFAAMDTGTATCACPQCAAAANINGLAASLAVFVILFVIGVAKAAYDYRKHRQSSSSLSLPSTVDYENDSPINGINNDHTAL